MHARFAGLSQFRSAVCVHVFRFAAGATFREARFAVLHFRKELSGDAAQGSAQFTGSLDLRGLTYERIYVAWKDFLGRQKPYDRQPYAQLEKALRDSGEDRKVDQVYLARRRRELWQKLRGADPASLVDVLYWLLARFGVRPFRLIGYTALLLFVATWAFHRPGAVRYSPPAQAKLTALDASKGATPATGRAAPPQNPAKLPAPAAGKCTASRDHPRLGLADSFRLSLRLFLPVDVPLASAWQASDKVFWRRFHFSDIAALLRLLGWVFVPLGIGALTGLLRRASP